MAALDPTTKPCGDRRKNGRSGGQSSFARLPCHSRRPPPPASGGGGRAPLRGPHARACNPGVIVRVSARYCCRIRRSRTYAEKSTRAVEPIWTKQDFSSYLLNHIVTQELLLSPRSYT